jgi:hypothetical protein
MDIFQAAAKIEVEEKTWVIVENLLKETTFSNEKIASLTEVTVEFVQEVKENLKKK